MNPEAVPPFVVGPRLPRSFIALSPLAAKQGCHAPIIWEYNNREPHFCQRLVVQDAQRRLFPLKVSKEIETVDLGTGGPQRVFVRHFSCHLLPAGGVRNVTI